MRVIIAGGRDFLDYEKLKEYCDKILSDIEYITIVSGKARGADTLGERYQKERNLQLKEYPAEWDIYDKAAGGIRNEKMAKNADMLIAFWDGKSSGTEDMIRRARREKLEVVVINY